MGYSCTAIAAYVQDELIKALQGVHNERSNVWVHKGQSYFYERGRENGDGSITGTIYQDWGSLARKKGSYCITADGIVKRWPTSNAKQRKLAESLGRKYYESRFLS
jgi:hypothetical protein